MFDDTELMAREAITAIKETSNSVSYSHIENLHLFLLNGVYVPTSFILTYISDNVNKTYALAANEIAKVEINISNATGAINTWLDKYNKGEIKYTMGEWRRVASAVSAGTNITIIFLKAFIKLINDLYNAL